MLVLIQEIILIEKTGQFVADDFFKKLDDVRCEGNWPIVGWVRLASSFVNRGDDVELELVRDCCILQADFPKDCKWNG